MEQNRELIISFQQIEQLPSPPFGQLQPFQEWTHNVEMALRVLDLLEKMDRLFSEPLHFCDVKPEHFGISKDGSVNILDSDNLALKSVIGKIN